MIRQLRVTLTALNGPLLPSLPASLPSPRPITLPHGKVAYGHIHCRTRKKKLNENFGRFIFIIDTCDYLTVNGLFLLSWSIPLLPGEPA